MTPGTHPACQNRRVLSLSRVCRCGWKGWKTCVTGYGTTPKTPSDEPPTLDLLIICENISTINLRSSEWLICTGVSSVFRASGRETSSLSLRPSRWTKMPGATWPWLHLKGGPKPFADLRPDSDSLWRLCGCGLYDRDAKKHSPQLQHVQRIWECWKNLHVTGRKHYRTLLQDVSNCVWLNKERLVYIWRVCLFKKVKKNKYWRYLSVSPPSREKGEDRS